jgi:hypothetical protein
LKVPIESLIPHLSLLDEALVKGCIGRWEYNRAHEEFLRAAGWGLEEWAEEIDRRWSWLNTDPMHQLPPLTFE